MKNSIFLFAIPLLFFSCGERTDSVNGENFEFSYTTDTVMVDAGQHFFFLNWDLQLADISQDRKYLYNLNPQTYLIEIVDLDNLKLKKTIQLEKEGPDGVGANYYGKIQVLENGNICLLGQFKINIVSEEGKLVNSIEFDQIQLKDYGLQEDEKIGWSGVISDDGKLFASTLSNVDYKKPARGIVLIDLETDSIKYIPMNLFQELKPFEILMQSGDSPGMIFSEGIFLSFMDEDLIISSTAFNESFRCSWSMDSLIHKTYITDLTENKKTGDFPTVVDNGKDLDEVQEKKKMQVDFGEFYEMQKHKLIWRVSREKDRTIGNSTVFMHVATFFDPELNMLKEQELENFHDFRKPFFKDGMLYSFLNIDDELAFVRLKPNFKDL
jgi:hypothetical protein